MNQNYNPNQQYNQPPQNQYPPQQGYYYQPQGAYNPYMNLSPEAQEQMRRIQYYKSKRNKEKKELIKKGIALGLALIGMLILEFAVVSALQLSSHYSLYETSALMQNCFNIFAVDLIALAIPFSIMALVMKNKSTPPLIPTKRIGKLKAAMWIAFGMGGCMAANYITNIVIELFAAFGYELSQPEMLPTQDPYTAIALIFSTAVAPAIFEEYAMRCCSLGLLKKHGKAFSVIAVSIVFGLIHANVIQFVFAFVVGLFLGYVTVKTDSVVPAMLIHGLNNGISVTQEILEYTSGENIAEYISTGIVVFWIIAAIGAIIYLSSNKEFKPKQKEPKLPYALNTGEKLLCLLPGLAVPFIILLVETSQFVTKI